MAKIENSTAQFLKKLANNNNRDWFTENKAAYEKARENMSEFLDEVILKLNEHDVIETPNGKKSLFRIYRDVRFSKDKTPYKSNFAAGFKRAGAERRGGYYFHFQPGNVMLGVGFWAPNKEDLARIRYDISEFHEDWREVLKNKNVKSSFGEMIGEQLKTAPKGYEKDHPAVDLLRYKQFIFKKEFTDAEALSPDFADKVNDAFKGIRPFFDYMSNVLTTDKNGESIL